MRYWFDTEFMEDGERIDLLSIGIVAEDGRELYLESAEADWTRANPWVLEHVYPNLLWSPQVMTSLDVIKRQVHRFVSEVDPKGVTKAYAPKVKPEFWAYYASYDWVAMCQLFGRMVDLPKGWPMYCRDFKQWLDEHGNPELAKLPAGRAHNALEDARWLRDRFQALHD